MEPKTWVNVSASPTVIGEKYYTLLPITEAKTFYRLFRPDGRNRQARLPHKTPDWRLQPGVFVGEAKRR